MKTLWQSIIRAALIAGILAAGVQPAAAAKEDILFGTTGACNNSGQGGPCTQTSTLVQLDPSTGAFIKVIGSSVGYTVNGLAWDPKSQQLYASTAIGCGVGSVCPFHGLITIDIITGVGTPVNPAAGNFGLAGDESPIHSITINSAGRMVAWYDELSPGLTDTFVQIDKTTGVATEFPDTGIDTFQNGLSFDRGNNQLWNIDRPRAGTQTAYLLDSNTGKPFGTVSLSPPTMAALGDFNPRNRLYYGLEFTPFNPTTSIVVVNLRTGTVTRLGPTVDGLHTLAFAQNVQ